MLMLEQNIIKRRGINKNNKKKLDTGNNASRKYQIKAIDYSTTYIKKLENNLVRLYNLVF